MHTNTKTPSRAKPDSHQAPKSQPRRNRPTPSQPRQTRGAAEEAARLRTTAARIWKLWTTPTTQPHATRARYMHGCRCLPCRAANSRYQMKRALEQVKGNTNRLVPTDEVRRHIRKLSARGIGYKQIAKIAKINAGTLMKIRNRERVQMQAQGAKRVLAVTTAARAPTSTIPAAATWRRLKWLLNVGGFTKTRLARLLGSRSKRARIQIQHDRVQVRTAENVKRVYNYYHDEPRPATATRAGTAAATDSSPSRTSRWSWGKQSCRPN